MAKPSASHGGTKELLALGQAIRAQRLAIGYSQEALADEAEVDRSYLGGIERGEHNVAIVNILKISAALNLSGSELLKLAKL